MKLQDFTFSNQTRKDGALVDFINEINSIINKGRYQMRITSTVPTYTGDDGEHLLYISGSVRRLYFYDATNSTWHFVEWNGAGIGQASIVASVQLTGQTGDIAATTLYTPAAAGLYRVSVYTACTTAGTGTLTTQIGWDDLVGAKTVSPAGDLDLSNTANATTGATFINTAAAVIEYATSIAGKAGSPQYSLDIVLERLV